MDGIGPADGWAAAQNLVGFVRKEAGRYDFERGCVLIGGGIKSIPIESGSEQQLISKHLKLPVKYGLAGDK